MKMIIVFAALSLLAQDPPLIDLVTEPANPGGFRKVTTFFSGRAFGDPNPPPLPKLPLHLHLESIEPVPNHPTLKIIQLLITNVGKEHYALPVGRDGEAALRLKNRGRRELWFGLWTDHERLRSLPGAPVYSSADLPDSVMLIKPNGTVRIRFSFEVEQARNMWKTELKGGIPVRAQCVEYSYDDNQTEYIRHHPAPDALSANELFLPLVPEDMPKEPED
jgi:hypothetical protein